MLLEQDMTHLPVCGTIDGSIVTIMRRFLTDPSRSPVYPLKVFLSVLLAVFAVEGTIMIVLATQPVLQHNSIVEGLLDATVLTLIVAPVVWVFTVLPLKKLFDARGRLLRQLFVAQEEERARIARDLHDGIGQQLSALLVGLKNVQEAPSPAEAGLRLEELRKVGLDAHQEVRRIARHLRPGVLEELGLLSGLERLCEEFERTTGIAVTHSLKALDVSLTADAETSIFRITQEALGNVARHSAATSVDVALSSADGHIDLKIQDNGHGFDPASRDRNAFGINSMKERAVMFNGDCQITTSFEKGTLVHVTMPLHSVSSVSAFHE